VQLFIQRNAQVAILVGVFLCMLSQTTLKAEQASDWIKRGEAALLASQQVTPKQQRAKNVILFVGDGMGVATITAARILKANKKALMAKAIN